MGSAVVTSSIGSTSREAQQCPTWHLHPPQVRGTSLPGAPLNLAVNSFRHSPHLQWFSKTTPSLLQLLSLPRTGRTEAFLQVLMLLSPVRKLLSRVCLLKLLPLHPCQLRHARAVACLRRFPVFVRLTTLMGRWRRPPLATVVSVARVNEARATKK
ncbi:hypothetical protein BC829DRAFT_429898 [Chytridium lagenaria]|nr:hypothetical protein BC829DRAFT_429898 [Chytridium lagenaria]